MEYWYSDKHTKDVKISMKIKKQIVSHESMYQRIDILETLEYDDNPPVDENGQIIQFNDKSTDSNDKNHLVQAENRKKKSN